MTVSKFIAYLTSMALGATAGLGGLFLAFDRLVMPDEARDWRGYHEIILDYVPGPRVLIDSGSNTVHSIAPELIEAELHRPALVIADNATVPLRLKIERLEKYAKPGDVVILPLEWRYYKTKSMATDFLDHITKEFSTYYFVMPWTGRFAFFVGHVQLDHIVSAISRLGKSTPRPRRRQSHERAMEEKFNWFGVTRTSPENRKRHVSMEGKSCRAFAEVPTGAPADFIKKAAARLSRLQGERRVAIVLTWPALAGADCYDFAEFDAYVVKLKKIFNDAGIAVVGDPRSSLFPPEHMLDTYYHVDIDAAYARTRRLIDDIEAAGVLPVPPKQAPETASTALIAAALAREEARVGQNDSSSLAPLATGDYVPGTEAFENVFQMPPGGWQEFEGWGVWSRGERSEIRLRPRPDKACRLKFDRRYFAKARPSAIWLDGTFVKFDDGGPISIPPGDRPATIAFAHQDVHSPLEMGESDDARALCLGVARLAVDCD